MEKIQSLLGDKARRREMILSLIFGIFTTVVNLAVYHLLTVAVAADTVILAGTPVPVYWFQVASVLAWIAAVSFAYVGNKLFVFQSRNLSRTALWKEAASFFGARVLSLILFDLALMSFCVRVLDMNDFLAKLLMNVLVVIFNYVASKLVIFKKKV